MTLLLDDITLTYADGDGRLTALDRVGLRVPAGGLTAVVGPSGSGKSSLLAVAATLVTPDSGRVTVDGTEATGLTRSDAAELRRRAIGIVFQQPNLLPSLTALEQLQVMAHLEGRKPREVRDRASELLEAVGLSAQSHRRPHQLGRPTPTREHREGPDQRATGTARGRADERVGPRTRRGNPGPAAHPDARTGNGNRARDTRPRPPDGGGRGPRDARRRTRHFRGR